MLQSIRIFKDVKDFRDIFSRLTWEMLENLALIPLLIFCCIPALYLILNQIPGMVWFYFMLAQPIHSMCSMLGVAVALIVLGKLIYTPSELKVYSMQNRITIGCFALFSLLVIASTCVNGFTSYALYGLGKTNESIFCLFTYFWSYFLCGAVIRTPKRKKLLIRTFVTIGTFHGIFVVIDGFVFQIDCLRGYWPGGFAGGFTNPNHYGYYLTILMLLAAGMVLWDSNKVWKVIAFVSFLMHTVILQFNNTLGAFLAVFLGLIFLIVVYKIVYRKFSKTSFFLLGGFVILSVITGFFSSDLFESLLKTGFDLSRLFQGEDKEGTGGSSRVLLWRLTLKKIAEKPLLGHGMDGIADYLEANNACKDVRTHNEYLQYTAFFGIPAGISYIVGIFCVFLSGLRQKARMNPETLIVLTGAFGYAISAFFGVPLIYTAPYFFIVLGLGFTLPLSAETVQEEPSKDEIEKTA